MQIKALAKLLEKHPEWRDTPDFELVLIGSARNEGDENRIKNLQQEAKDLGVQVIMDIGIKQRVILNERVLCRTMYDLK